jgi:oxygen-dependent protoporphyrinogen oxidase
MSTMESAYDCIVLGAGVAGLGAALTLKDAGVNVCVLEKDERVGGRMTTDRMNGYIMDRGVTILGNEFKNMKGIVKRFSLQKHVSPIRFSFGMVEGNKRLSFRAKRVDDLLFHHDLKFSTRLALARFGLDVMLNRHKLYHGLSAQHGELDDESVSQYMERINGPELKNRIMSPGMTCAFGGHFEESSKLILLQTFRNILMTGSWTMDTGVDLIPETMAGQFPVKLNCGVSSVEYNDKGATVKTTDGEIYFCKAVVVALPGDKVPAICRQLPGNILQALEKTKYGKMTNAHLGMDHVIPEKYFAMGAAKKPAENYLVELEHNRCKALCPEGKSMATIFWWDSPENKVSAMKDAEIKQQIDKTLSVCLPDEISHVEFSHIVKWDTGIAHFPVGRLQEMGELRREMKIWDRPVQLCGDYLDGISSEGALQTGIEAGINMINYLKKK